MATGWLEGLEERAWERLGPELLEYVLQGAGEGLTAAEATAAWRSVRLLPRVLRDVTTVDLGADLLGPAEVPWGVAPTTLQRAVHPEGEVAMARATRDVGTVLVVSSNSGTSFADIGATGVRWWLQAYLPRERSLAHGLLGRAVAAGAEAVVLTLDTPVVGSKRIAGDRAVWDVVSPSLLRVNFDPEYDDAAPGAAKAPDLGPDDLAWLARETGLPVVAKGVLREDDARRSVEAGAAAVWVSNHGGRQLDRAAPTARCLPAVVAAVGGSVPVFVDGGVRSGLDLLTALALGADGVFVGRGPLLALSEGEQGVARYHAELRSELVEALRLTGCSHLADTRGLALGSP